MFAGLLSAIGFKAVSPKSDVLTIEALHHFQEDMSECELYNDTRVCFWVQINGGPWEFKRMKAEECELFLYDAESR